MAIFTRVGYQISTWFSCLIIIIINYKRLIESRFWFSEEICFSDFDIFLDLFIVKALIRINYAVILDNCFQRNTAGVKSDHHTGRIETIFKKKICWINLGLAYNNYYYINVFMPRMTSVCLY